MVDVEVVFSSWGIWKVVAVEAVDLDVMLVVVSFCGIW